MKAIDTLSVFHNSFEGFIGLFHLVSLVDEIQRLKRKNAILAHYYQEEAIGVVGLFR